MSQSLRVLHVGSLWRSVRAVVGIHALGLGSSLNVVLIVSLFVWFSLN